MRGSTSIDKKYTIREDAFILNDFDNGSVIEFYAFQQWKNKVKGIMQNGKIKWT